MDTTQLPKHYENLLDELEDVTKAMVNKNRWMSWETATYAAVNLIKIRATRNLCKTR